MGKTICLDVEVSTYQSYSHREIFNHFDDEAIQAEYFRRLQNDDKSVSAEKIVCMQIEHEFNTHQVKEI